MSFLSNILPSWGPSKTSMAFPEKRHELKGDSKVRSAVSSTFEQDSKVNGRGRVLEQAPVMQTPLHHPLVRHILRNKPIGLDNLGNNCWLISMLQSSVLKVPEIMDWIMDVDLPLSDEQFEVEAKALLATGRDADRQTYVQMHLKQFLFAYYDHQLKKTPVPAEDVHKVRVALSNVSHLDSSPAIQEDGVEGLTVLMNFLSKDSPLIKQMDTELTLSNAQVPFPRGHNGVSRVTTPEWGNISLPLKDASAIRAGLEGEFAESKIKDLGAESYAALRNEPDMLAAKDKYVSERLLAKLLGTYFFSNNPEHAGMKLEGSSNKNHMYPVRSEQRRYNTPPKHLFINLKRFETEVAYRSEGSWWSGYKMVAVAERIKINDPIPIPKDGYVYFSHDFMGGLREGELARYQVESISVHLGKGAGGGHYYSLVKRGNEWWYVNDSTSRKATSSEKDYAFNNGYNHIFSYNGIRGR